MARFWYLYDPSRGPDTATGSYVLPAANPYNFCDGGPITCQILVPAGGPNPAPGSITPGIQINLAIAKANHYPCYPFGAPEVCTRT